MFRLACIFFFISKMAFSQCPPSSITLNTQTEVDQFILDYPNCTELPVPLRIEGPDIANLNGLSNLTHLDGGALILGNPILSNLNGFSNVVSIAGGLTIIDNNLVSDFLGLNNLVYIGGQLQIESNMGLLNFNGLENLDTISGQLFIYFNAALNDISAIENLEHIGESLVIANSFSLSECSIDAICDYIANPNGFIGIASNDSGCNNQQEVEDACDDCLESNTWVGPASGTWHNSNNWSLSKVPTACHHVIIPAGSSLKVSSGTSAIAYTIEIAESALFETEGNAILAIIAE